MRKIMLAMVMIAIYLYGCVPAIVGITRNVSKLYGAQGVYNRPDYEITVNSNLADTCAATEIALKKMDIQQIQEQKNEGNIKITGNTSNSKIQIVLTEITKSATRVEIKTGRDSPLALMIAENIKKN